MKIDCGFFIDTLHSEIKTFLTERHQKHKAVPILDKDVGGNLAKGLSSFINNIIKAKNEKGGNVERSLIPEIKFHPVSELFLMDEMMYLLLQFIILCGRFEL